MKTTMTLDEIRSFRPCESGWKKLLSNCGDKTDVSLIDILDSNDIDDALWATRCLPLRERRSLALRYALAVEHLSDDPRVSACNRATRQWLDGEITKGVSSEAAAGAMAAAELAAWAAAKAAAGAAWAAARAAARPARAAAWAAWAAVRAAEAAEWAAEAAAAWAAEAAEAAARATLDREPILRQWCADVESGVER